eukprot:Tamp_01823.p1 GENE.Tamp_01823~~Tamp_01823.p1  ORF type:complete len:276 (+),score=20.51 Tamp_01823:3978-4805(+)
MFVILVLLTYRHSSHGSFLFPVVHTGERIIELSHRRLLDKSCRGRALHFGHELPQPADSAQEMHEGFWRCNRSKGRDSDVGGESSPEDGMPLDGRRGSFMDSHGNSRGGIGRDERRKGGKQTGAFRPASAPPVRYALESSHLKHYMRWGLNEARAVSSFRRQIEHALEGLEAGGTKIDKRRPWLGPKSSVEPSPFERRFVRERRERRDSVLIPGTVRRRFNPSTYWTDKQELNAKVDRRLWKQEQVEQWERKTLLGLQRTTQLIRTFSDMRELAR